uniref:VWFA domain-containing protein n=1 Tax=Acrobeloides nanus TaxID=290746 RepID=A0A914DD81_9BILA
MELVFGRVDQSSGKLSGPIPCSNNASEAWADVVFMIDNSVNMGSSNLRKINTLANIVMSKFPIGTNPNITQGVHNTRVAVITYNYKATTVAGFNDINNVYDLNKVLNGIEVSDKKEANLYDAILQSTFLLPLCNAAFCDSTARPRVLLIFAAANK